MTLEKIIAWLDKTLKVAAFDDVSNNGLQIARDGASITTVAFAVDASVKAIETAAKGGAQLLVVHHGISWGGGIKRLTGGVFNVVKAAREANLALYACHLPLDAHPTLGNNAGLAKALGLENLMPAFSYHGNVIGFIGEKNGEKIGVCSGGAAEFAEEAKRLGCRELVTGEANWGEVIAAENCGAKITCLGHYETEIYGVQAVSAAMRKALKIKTFDIIFSNVSEATRNSRV